MLDFKSLLILSYILKIYYLESSKRTWGISALHPLCFNLGINENVAADFGILMKILYFGNVDLDIDMHLVGISRKDKNNSLCLLYCLMRSNPYGQSFLPTGKKKGKCQNRKLGAALSSRLVCITTQNIKNTLFCLSHFGSRSLNSINICILFHKDKGVWSE